MKKFVIIVLILVGLGYYFKDDILAKKNEMKLKSFKEAQTKFWREAKKVSGKKKLKKAFDKAEKGILDGTISEVEYQDINRFLNIATKDQQITKEEAKSLIAVIDKKIGTIEALVR